jgi:hypothetical protein
MKHGVQNSNPGGRPDVSKTYSKPRTGIHLGSKLYVPSKIRRWRAGRRGDTSPLPGLAYANGAVAYANVFATSSLRGFRARRGAVRLAYANLLILWVAPSFARFPKA